MSTTTTDTATPDADRRQPAVVQGGGALVAENLGKSFKRRPVVRGVSMSVKRGEVVGLLGPNGAGKTTCFLYDHRPYSVRPRKYSHRWP